MENTEDVSLQTDPSLMLEFLIKYDTGKLLALALTQKYTEKEVLDMSIIRGKGRPARRTSHGDIEAMALRDKLKVLAELFDDVIHRLMSVVIKDRRMSKERRRRGGLIKRNKNIMFRRVSDINPTDESTSPVLMSQLDDRTVHMLANGLPRIKSGSFLEGLNGRIQLVIAYYLYYIGKRGFFSNLNTLNFSSFRDAGSSQVFNMYFLLAAFVFTLADFLSQSTLKGFFILLVCYLDYAYPDNPLLALLEHAKVVCQPLALEFDARAHVPLTPSAIETFTDSFLGFSRDPPVAYHSLLHSAFGGDFSASAATMAALVELFKDFGEIFLKLEKFHQRL